MRVPTARRIHVTRMKRDVEQAIERPASWTTWRRAPVLAAVLAVAGILGVYAETVASIVAIWVRSDTFAHGFVVAPISLWLIWRRAQPVDTAA